jgi:hypothetical protein
MQNNDSVNRAEKVSCVGHEDDTRPTPARQLSAQETTLSKKASEDVRSRMRIERRERVVEEDEISARVHCSRKRDSLFLTSRECHTSLSNHSLDAIGKGCDIRNHPTRF